MTVSIPYDWIKQVPRELLETSNIPLFGYPPPFPWDQLSAVLQKIFKQNSFELRPSNWTSREAHTIFEGLGRNPIAQYIEFASLEGIGIIAMAEDDLNRLMNLLLSGKADEVKLIDPDYREGFYEFILLESFSICKKLDYASEISPHFTTEKSSLSGACFCQDIALNIDGESFLLRLIVSDELKRSWQSHFAENKLSVSVPKEISDKIQVIVHLEAGHVSLEANAWEDIQIGDCILLDDCSFEDTTKGRVILTLNGVPIYRAKVKDGELKILESPFFRKITAELSPQQNQKKIAQKEEAPLADTLDEEFSDFDEDFTDFDEDEPHEVMEEQAAPKPKAASKPLPTAKDSEVRPAEQQTAVSSGPPLQLSDIPLTIIVEVGRMQISMQKLIELQPGDLIELGVHPEAGVDLVLQGNVIGKGELLKIGDVLGVRIIDKV